MAEMKKGKGYPSHVKDSAKSFGDPFKSDCIGKWEMSADLNEWDYGEYKLPDAKKGK